MNNPWDKMLMPQFGAQQMAENSPLMNPAMQSPQMPVMQAPIQMPMKSMSIRQSVNESGDNRKYQNEFDDQFKASMDTRNLDLGALKEKLAQLEVNKPGMLESANLKPLMAFADSLTGGRSAQSYDAPTAAKDHDSKLERFQKAIADNSNSITDDQLSYLKSKAQEEMFKSREISSERRQNEALGRSTLNNEFKLRNEWDGDPITKNTKSVNEAFQKVNQAYKSGSDPATYLTMIYGLMRMQDPNSTVRESEFKTGEGIGGWPEQWKAMYQKARGDINGPITELQKQAVVSQAKNIYQAQMDRQGMVDNKYKSMASEYGFNPGRVVLSDIFKPTEGSAQTDSGAMDFDNMSEAELAKYLGK